jgi:hypothetical protein
MPVAPSTRSQLDDHLGQAEFSLTVAVNFDCLNDTPAHDTVRAALARVPEARGWVRERLAVGTSSFAAVSGPVGAGLAAELEGTSGVSPAMSARALGVMVTGGRHVLRADDFGLIEGTRRVRGAKMGSTDGSAGVAGQVEAWAERRGFGVSNIMANWIHEGPATPEERKISLVELAGTVSAFPGEEPTDDLLERARRRRRRLVESPGRLAAQRPMLARPVLNLTRVPRQRSGLSPKL